MTACAPSGWLECCRSWWTFGLERHGELQLDPAVRAALERMSPATIDRRLAAKRRTLGRRPFTQSRSVGALRALVPLRTFGDWSDATPGAYQADLVAHCGETTEGHQVPHHPHGGGRGHQLAGL